jgi:uncharacterized protein YpbB
MTYFQAILLYCFQQIQTERTMASVFHLLKGKKSSQTIQDAFLYNLHIFFHLFPFLKRKDFENELEQLSTYGWIYLQDGRVQVTEQGKQQVSAFFQQEPWPSYLNGWKYQDAAIVFWKRLTLSVQVVSNLIYYQKEYYPIQRETNVLRWMKWWLKQHWTNRRDLANKLYDELFTLFQHDAPEDPSLVVYRLTGAKRIGMTGLQVAESLNIPYDTYWVKFIHILHYALQTIQKHKKDYPLLYSMVEDLLTPLSLTNSTKETYQLIQKGWTISRIAQYRSLKKSTIEDHIIEITLNDPTFSIEPFVDNETIRQVREVAASMKNRRLKPIKERLPHVEYFQIRLVLAKYGEVYEHTRSTQEKVRL